MVAQWDGTQALPYTGFSFFFAGRSTLRPYEHGEIEYSNGFLSLIFAFG